MLAVGDGIKNDLRSQRFLSNMGRRLDNMADLENTIFASALVSGQFITVQNNGDC